jgi:hypothetical protein
MNKINTIINLLINSIGGIEKISRDSYDLTMVETENKRNRPIDLYIPSLVTILGNKCFSYCEQLESIEIPTSVTSIGKACFSDCLKLKHIVLPEGLKILDDKCFFYCRQLESIKIPASVTSIGIECFYHCERLESIEIPASVTSIGIQCFSDCLKLKTIKIKHPQEQHKNIIDMLSKSNIKARIVDSDNIVLFDSLNQFQNTLM